MMSDKDIKAYHSLIKKLEKKKKVTMNDEDEKLQQEQRDLDESYQQSKRNKREREENEEYLREIKDKL
tara:strand:+ start:368 stop:571 length:204 start_codon:yes stop_codon:yes gene_type:complete